MIGVCLALAALAPHGQIEEQIELMNRLIQASPDNPRHRLRRGELLRLHGENHATDASTAARDWADAEKDFARALALDPGLPGLHLAWGRMRLSAGRAAEAVDSLERHLEKEPDDPEGRLYHARALAAAGRREDALLSYDRSIDRAPAPAPDVYLERAALLDASGRRAEAVRGLDEGLARLGPLAVFDLRALELEAAMERWEAALARVDRRLSAPGRKEEWHLRRAEILRKTGRTDEAAAACEAALAAIAALPPSRRDTPACAEIERRARALLSR